MVIESLKFGFSEPEGLLFFSKKTTQCGRKPLNASLIAENLYNNFCE